MKKKSFLAVALLLFMAIPMQAQFSFGIKGGVNMVNNSLSGLVDVAKGDITNKDNYTGFFIGPKAEFRIPVIGLGIEGAVMYSQTGMTLADQNKFNQSSIVVPINLKYGIGLGNIANIFITAGPEFDFNVGETSKFITTPEGGLQAYVAQKSTFGINVGAGVTFINHIQLAVNYNIPCGKTANIEMIDKEDLGADYDPNTPMTEDKFNDIKQGLQNVDDAYNTAKAKIKAGVLQVSVAYLF